MTNRSANNDRQAQRLREALDVARRQGVPFEIAHLANSPATLARPDLAFDMVRPGVAVYGLNPLPGTGRPRADSAMTLKSPVAMVRVGTGRGRGVLATLERRRRHHGRADPARICRRVFQEAVRPDRRGDQRPALSNVGRICMDQFVVDLGPGPVDVAAGDQAVLFGPGTAGEQTAQDWADLLGTIHYEVVTSPRGRVVRAHRGVDV